MLKAVIFDLDHTLYDRHGTLAAIVPALRRTFEVDPALSDEEIAKIWCYADDSFVYDGWSYILACLTEKGVFLTPPAYADYRSFMYREFARTAVSFDYALPLLEGFKKEGLLVGLITNGRHELQYSKLALTGLEYVFDDIIVSGDVGVEKPDREIFEIACERLGIAPAEAVYVGDNRKNDVDGALGAGMRAVWLAVNPGQRGKREPTAVIKDLRELPGVICGMRGAE